MPEPKSAAVWVPINSLTPWKDNPRHNEDAIPGVMDSLKRFGWGAPLLARQSNREVIAGHTRLLAAQRLGMSEVPVRFLDITEIEAHALAISDNKTGEVAQWWDEKLVEILDELAADTDLGLEGTGFDLDELEALEKEVETKERKKNRGDADVPDPGALPKTPRSKLGEVYQLGPHRLLCGDATSVADVAKLMGDEKADLLWTDPPYNVAYEGAAGKIQNDEMSAEKFLAFLVGAMKAADSALAPGGAFYIAHADTEGLNFRASVKAVDWKLASCIIWLKDSLVMGRGDYHWIHEPILYGWKPGAAHHAVADRKQTTVW